MRKYEVYLVRYASLFVTAENEEEAEKEAQKLLHNGYEVSTETCWMVDYADIAGI